MPNKSNPSSKPKLSENRYGEDKQKKVMEEIEKRKRK